MAIQYYQSFSVTGVANQTVYDTGLTSTEAQEKRLISLLVNVSGYVANQLQIWIEREKIAEVYDYMLNTEASSGSANVQYATNKLLEIPCDIPIPVGQTLKVAIICGATAKNLFGSYRYEIA